MKCKRNKWYYGDLTLIYKWYRKFNTVSSCVNELGYFCLFLISLTPKLTISFQTMQRMRYIFEMLILCPAQKNTTSLLNSPWLYVPVTIRENKEEKHTKERTEEYYLFHIYDRINIFREVCHAQIAALVPITNFGSELISLNSGPSSSLGILTFR